ncbi:MAG: DNA/RNA non-specific endonuclease [Flavobacteriales bacterium]
MRILIHLFIFLIPSLLSSQTNISDSIKSIEKNLENILTEEYKLLKKLEELKLKESIEFLYKFGVPQYNSCSQTVKHSAMILCYDENHEQARWVYHIISPEIEKGAENRSNDFRVDPKITTGTAVKDDYWYSGYDRGHLAPSADFKWSKKALSESFYYSNMSPQRPELNRKRWAELEDVFREYVVTNKRPLWVVTGPILKEGLATIGENKVSVPEHYYKVAFDFGDTLRGIGFIMPNSECPYPVFTYAVTIDSVESITGINFYPSLSKEDEEKVESTFELNNWSRAKDKGNITPVHHSKLPKGKFNTIQAKYHVGEEITVCGTVVSSRYVAKSGMTYLNLDQKFPNQLFTIRIDKSSRSNFTYIPENELDGKTICVKGKISIVSGTPTMDIKNEKAVTVVEDDEFSQ